jgi:arsenate reductase
MFSDSFAGIAPASAPAFVGAQLVGGLVGMAAVRLFYPGASPATAAVVAPPRNIPADADGRPTAAVDRHRPA